jgi:tetratricopeptide (TPR) repeat protein
MRCPRFAVACFLIVSIVPAVRADAAKDAAALYQRALDSDRNQRPADALEAIQQAIQLDPERAHYHGLAGWLHLKTKNFAAGLRASEAAVRLANGRNDAFFLFLAGENAYHDREAKLAIKYFRAALARGESALDATNVFVVKERLYMLQEKTLEFEWRLDPKRALSLKRPDGSFAVPIPAGIRWPFQKRKSLLVLGAASHKVEQIEGNDVIALVPEGNHPIRVVMKVTLHPFSYKARLAGRTKPGTYSALIKPYLGESEWINPRSRVLQKVVEPLRRPDSLATVVQVVEYLRKNLRYIQNENLLDAGDVAVESTLGRGQASCHGWSAACVGVCRAAGVPARMVVVLSARDRSRFGYHDIVEVFIPSAGWIPLEPQPGGVIGMPGTTVIRLYHYVPRRRWGVNDPDKIHLFNILGALETEGAVTYNLTK